MSNIFFMILPLPKLKNNNIFFWKKISISLPKILFLTLEKRFKVSIINFSSFKHLHFIYIGGVFILSSFSSSGGGSITPLTIVLIIFKLTPKLVIIELF